MKIDVLSDIPELFDSYMSLAKMRTAQEHGVLEFCAHDLHTWGQGVRRNVDDAPFGGGAGQLMMAEPIYSAVRELSSKESEKPYVIFFTPTGTSFNQRIAERLSTKEHLLFVCGRYEGIDERAYKLADECLSLGDYVLTGGELAAMTVTDAVVRLLPGVLHNAESFVEESFSSEGLLEYAQYTRPAQFEGMDVPEVLLSGNHAAIRDWRRKNAIERTAKLRPDLLEKANLSASEREFAAKVLNGELS